MPLPNTTINVIGEIVRPALNKDGVSGIVFYNDNIADLTTFSATTRIVKFTNLPAIEATGITKDSVNFQEEHYQISEFFRAGGGEIYIGIYDEAVSAYDFLELDELYKFSSGEIRQYSVYNPQNVLDATDVSLIESIVAEYDVAKQPAIALLAQDISTLQLSALADLRNLPADAEHVSVIIGQDTQGTALSLTTTNDRSTPNLGIVLGTLANAGVEENILDMGIYNYTNGVEMVIPGFYAFDGVSKVMIAINEIDKADQDVLNDKGYIFWRYAAISGTYLSNDNNSVNITKTFNSIHIMRPRNKVIRELDTALTPLIGSKLLFNGDGTLRPIIITKFTDVASTTMLAMKRDSEISAYEVFVDPTQDSLTTKTVIVQVSIVPVESSDNIIINVSFVASL